MLVFIDIEEKQIAVTGKLQKKGNMRGQGALLKNLIEV